MKTSRTQKLSTAQQPKVATQQEIDEELAYIAQTKGWHYAQLVAEKISDKFKCEPGDEKWEAYTHMRYAYEQLFGRIRAHAANVASIKRPSGQSILAEIKNNARNRDGK